MTLHPILLVLIVLAAIFLFSAFVTISFHKNLERMFEEREESLMEEKISMHRFENNAREFVYSHYWEQGAEGRCLYDKVLSQLGMVKELADKLWEFKLENGLKTARLDDILDSMLNNTKEIVQQNAREVVNISIKDKNVGSDGKLILSKGKVIAIRKLIDEGYDKLHEYSGFFIEATHRVTSDNPHELRAWIKNLEKNHPTTENAG